LAVAGIVFQSLALLIVPVALALCIAVNPCEQIGLLVGYPRGSA